MAHFVGFVAPGMLALATGCGPGNWSVESEPVDGSVTLLDNEAEASIVLSLETTHTGRANVFVTLPGYVKQVPEEDPDLGIPVEGSKDEVTDGSLVAVELVLDDAHSALTLPGVGGHMSVVCPGERCAKDEATLTLRVLDSADVPEDGFFLRWEAIAETFGEGAAAPQDAEASVEVED